jgi:hypothetical protein
MTVDEILEVVTCCDYPDMQISLNQLNGMLINRLAAISDRISSEEMSQLISISVVLYQKGFKEQLANSELDNLLDSFADRPFKEK